MACFACEFVVWNKRRRQVALVFLYWFCFVFSGVGFQEGSQCLAGFWGLGMGYSAGLESQVRAMRKRTFVARIGNFQEE